MIDTNRKEDLSYSYLNAICATRGIATTIQGHDDDGIDVMLKKVMNRKAGGLYNAQMSVQMKSTSSNFRDMQNCWTYPLKKKNYDDMRMPATVKPFLFLFILAEEEGEWIEQGIDVLILRKCMYWLDLKGLPDSNNTTTVTVHIPKTNVVTADFLESTLACIAEEEII